MSPERFDNLFLLVTPLISKKDTKFRKSIHTNERLALTLKFLASEESQISLSFQFRLERATVSKISIYEGPDHRRSKKRLHNSLKIHGICCTSQAQSMGSTFELNVQKTLEAYNTTTRDFLALFYQLSATLITALRFLTLVNIPVITIAASLFTATWEDILKITQIISRKQSQ